MSEPEIVPGAALEVIEPSGARRTVQVTQSPFLIGRGSESGNHLPLPDSRISRQCAALTYENGAFRLQDRGTRRGIFVNGVKIDSHPLRDADTITFGIEDGVELVFHVGGAGDSLPELLSRFEQAAAMEGGARELRHLTLLLEATTLLQSHMPLEDVLGAMVDRAILLTGAERGLLLEMDVENQLWPLVARGRGARKLPAESLSPSRTVLKQVLEQQHSVVEENLELANAALRGAQSIIAQSLRSVIAIPLFSHRVHAQFTEATILSSVRKYLGVLYLDSGRSLIFSKLERRILDTLALESASILEKALLVKKEREQMRLEQELAAARNIQQSLLPKRFPTHAHLQLTAINRSCSEVGGDYFDILELGPGRTAFLIADVCGKGLGAALLTLILQGNFSAVTLGHDAAQVCSHVNRFIYERAEGARFVTLFFGAVDVSGRLEYINAGHVPPLLVRGNDADYVFEATNVPVGVVWDAHFEVRSCTLSPGDTLVLFTDGITEARNLRREMFGTQRLKEVVQSHARREIQEIQAGIMSSVEDFTRGVPPADDLTLLILRYRGDACPKPGDKL